MCVQDLSDDAAGLTPSQTIKGSGASGGDQSNPSKQPNRGDEGLTNPSQSPTNTSTMSTPADTSGADASEGASDLIFPYVYKLLTSDPYIDRAKEYYIRKDIEIILYHFEEWIQNGFKQSPKELIEYIRMCHALHGKWQYQVSTRKTPDIYSMEKFVNNEW